MAISSVHQKVKLGTVLIYLLFFILLACTISQKLYFHPNENSSYILANKNADVIFGDNGDAAFQYYIPIDYTNCNYASFTAPVKEECFDYAGVWKRQAQDTHPPLYYALLHTICSFFPGTFSKWYAGIINIVFALLTLFAARKIIRLYTDDRLIISVISLVVVLSSAVLNASAFLRMYVMAMFWITLETYLFAKQAEEQKISRKFCAKIFTVSLVGALTHYYCAFYAALLSAVFATQLIYEKKLKDAVQLIISQISAAIMFVIIFPASIQHIFFGARGAESFANAADMSDYLERFGLCWQILCRQLFGGMLLIILAAMLYFYVKDAMQKKSSSAEENGQNILPSATLSRKSLTAIFVPIIIYFMIIAKTAHIQKPYDFFEASFSRYLHPVYAVLLTSVLVCLFVKLKEKLSAYSAKCAILLTAFLIILGSWFFTDWNMDFLYRSHTSNIAVDRAYSGADCVCITSIGINFTEVFELSEHKNMAVLPVNFDMKQLRNFTFGNQLVICIEAPGANTDQIMAQIMQYLPEFRISMQRSLFFPLGSKYYLDRAAM